MSLTRSTGSGLLSRYEFDNGSFPFSTGDWTAPSGVTLSISSSKLRLAHIINSFDKVTRNTALADSGEHMVFVRMVRSSGAGLGAGALWSNVSTRDGIEGSSPNGFSGTRMLGEWTANSRTTIDSTGSVNNSSPQRSTVWANGTDALLRDHNAGVTESGAYSNGPKTGKPGVFTSTSAVNNVDVEKWFAFTGRYVTVTGLTPGSGQKAKIRSSSGTVLVSGTESGGTAVIDCLPIESFENFHDLLITDSSDAPLEQYTGDVWPGETWAFVTPVLADLSRTSASGLLDRNEYDNASFPFSTSEWTTPTGVAKAISSGKLSLSTGASATNRVTTRDISDVTEMMVYSRCVRTTAYQLGNMVLCSDNTVGSLDGVTGDVPGGFSGNRNLMNWVAGTPTAVDQTGGINDGDPVRISTWCDANRNCAMRHHFFEAIESGVHAAPAKPAGKPGLFHSATAAITMDCEKFFAFSGRYITVTGLQAGSGQKARLCTANGTLLAEATESGGTATIDGLTVEAWWTAANLQATTSTDSFLAQFEGDVWAGETWEYENRPDQPTITATATGPRSVTVEGSDYSHPNSVPLAGVEWRRADDSGMSVGVESFEIDYDDPSDAPDPLSYGWEDLEPGTTYWFDVRYRDSLGIYSARSTAVSETTDTEATPDTPTITSAVADTDSVILQATPFSDPLGRSHVRSQWQAATAAGSYASPVNEQLNDVVAPLTNETLLGLSPATNYKARVRYQADDGTFTSYSADKLFSTTAVPANRPTQPTLSVTAIEQTATTLNGSGYSDPQAVPHQRTRWYITNWPGGGTFGLAYRVLDVTTTVDLLSRDVTGLQPGVLYNAAVRYQAADGDWSDWSAWVPFTTTAAPLDGALLQITQPRQGAPIRGATVSVQWTPASFTGDTFELEYSANLGASWSWIALADGVTSSPYSWNVSGLTDGIYILRIRAVSGDEVTDWQNRIVYVDNANMLAGNTFLFNYNADNLAGDGVTLADWEPAWEETDIAWTITGTTSKTVRYSLTDPTPTVQTGRIESALTFLPAFEPRQVDVIGEVLIGSAGGSFPWNWFPEQAWAGVGVFAQGGVVAGVPEDGISATIVAVPITAFGDCEVRGSGDGFLEIGWFENGSRRTAASVPIGRVHVVNQFDGCNKVPRYGVRLRLTTVADLGNGRRRMRVQASAWGRGVTVPESGWHTEATIETDLDCGCAAFVSRNINTTNGSYRQFTNLTVIPYEYGACLAPPSFVDTVDLETCPPPIFDLTIYEPDDVTPMFGFADDYGGISEPSFSTFRGHPRPWLKVWGQSIQHEVDPIRGSSSIGTFSCEVVDKRIDPCDPKTGFLTFWGADESALSALIGRRAVARERLEDGTYQVVANGPIMEVALLDTFVTYSLRIGSMRERERDVALFDTQYETLSAYPWGPVEGYGFLGTPFSSIDLFLIPAAAVATGTYVAGGVEFAELPEEFLPSLFAFIQFGAIENTSSTSFSVRQDLATVGSPIITYEENGFARPTYSNAVLRWRYPGDDDDDWRYIRNMPGSTVSPNLNLFSFDNIESLSAIAYLTAVALALPDVFVNALVLNGYVGFQPLPNDGEEIEFQVLANLPVSEQFPFFYDGSMGDLLRRIYDGDFSPEEPLVRYDESCMAEFEANGPAARFYKTEPVDDLREWVEKNIYQASGWLPSLTDEGEICPIDAAIPDTAEGLVTLDNALVTNGRANWSMDGTRATPIVNYIFLRESRLPVSDDLVDQYDLKTERMQFIEIVDDAAQLIRNKTLVIEPETVRTIGGQFGQPLTPDLTDEAPGRLAFEIALSMVSRYAFGPQIVPVRVRDTALTRQLVVGSWVILDLDWIPNLAQLMRGGEQLGLVVRRQKDAGLAWNLTLLLLGPGTPGLEAPDQTTPVVGADNRVCVEVDVPTDYDIDTGGGGEDDPYGTGGGDPGESFGDALWALYPEDYENTATFRAASDVIIPAFIEENITQTPPPAGSIFALSINPNPPAGAPGAKTLDYTYNHGNNGCTSITITVPSIRWTPVQEAWHRFYIRYTPNFRTTNDTCPPNDHKLYFGDTQSDESGRWAVYVGADSGPAHTIMVERPRDPDLGPGEAGAYYANLNSGPEIKAIDLWDGEWHLFEFYTRHSTTTTSDDGAMRLRIDERLIHDEEGFNTCSSAADGNGIDRLEGVSFCHNKDDGPTNVTHILSWGFVEVFATDQGW